MIVCKFGGTSVANADQIKKVVEIVKTNPRRQVVVVSAPAGMTNALLRIWDMIERGEDWREHWNTEVVDRFGDIATGLGLNPDIKTILRDEFDAISAGQANRDLVASIGEAMNSRLVAAALGAKHVEAAEVIKFTEDARIDTALTYRLLREYCSEDERAVLGGFYGSLPSGKVKTLGRGGSDETAAHVAAALQAESCEIWTDVSGIMAADPRVVEAPCVIQAISPDEVFEMSDGGAKVLHPGAVAPVAKLGIPMWILNTNHPEQGGTLIHSDIQMTRNLVTGIAGQKPFTTFVIKKVGMNDEVGFGAKVLGAFQHLGIPYAHNPTGMDTMSIVVRSELMNGSTDQVADEIRETTGATVTVLKAHMALITVVSPDLSVKPMILASIFVALASASIVTLTGTMCCGGTSVVVGVRVEDYERATRILYNAFFPS